jgi:anti-anti-sigma factor
MPRDQHALVEQATDELCASRPLSVMCQYSTSEAAPAVGPLSQAHGAGVREQKLRAAPAPDGVGLAGELDASNWDLLRSVLAASTTAVDADPFVVDLSEVDFVDLPGARALLLGTVGYRDRGGRVQLRAPQRHVAQLLRLVGFEHEPGLVMMGRG